MKISLAASIGYIEARNKNDIQAMLLQRNIVAKVSYRQVPSELPQFFTEGKMFQRVEITVARPEYTLRAFADFKERLEIFLVVYDDKNVEPAGRKAYVFDDKDPTHIYDVVAENLV